MKSSEKLYKRFSISSQNQTENNIPVCTELFHVYEDAAKAATQLLGQCREYKSLDGHALTYIRNRIKQNSSKNREKAEATFFDNFLVLISLNTVASSKEPPVSEQELKAVKRQLETFVNGGMLIAKSKLQSKVQSAISVLNASPGKKDRISILGIPTTNRGDILLRSAESYLVNIHQNNRSCRLHIIDDSDESVQTGNNRKAVKKLCKQYETDLLWIDKLDRAELAHKIAIMSSAPKELM